MLHYWRHYLVNLFDVRFANSWTFYLQIAITYMEIVQYLQLVKICFLLNLIFPWMSGFHLSTLLHKYECRNFTKWETHLSQFWFKMLITTAFSKTQKTILTTKTMSLITSIYTWLVLFEIKKKSRYHLRSHYLVHVCWLSIFSNLIL